MLPMRNGEFIRRHERVGQNVLSGRARRELAKMFHTAAGDGDISRAMQRRCIRGCFMQARHACSRRKWLPNRQHRIASHSIA